MLLARVRSGVLLIVGLTWIAAWLLPLIVTDSPALIIVFVAAGTFAAPAVNAVMGGGTVAAVPAQLQGRADAAISFTSTLAMPLAPIIAGVGIEHLGFQPTVLALAVLVQLSILPCVISRPVRQLSTAADWPREPRSDGPRRRSHAADLTQPLRNRDKLYAQKVKVPRGYSGG